MAYFLGHSVYVDDEKLTFALVVSLSLGAYHDGQSNDCSSDDQYIMAKSPTQLHDRNFQHPYQFSHCSITYFRAYLNQLNTYVCHYNNATDDCLTEILY